MLYEVINPSDAVTFKARTFEAAFIATVLVGGGQYAAKPLGEGEDVPLFFLGGFEAFVRQRFPDVAADDLSPWIDQHRDDVIAALETFCTGSAKDRVLFDSALAAITDDAKRAEFIAGWDDKKRSSLNQITNRAHGIAKSLAARATQGA